MNHNMPIPLNDELALGLLGRFARLNGMSSTTWAINAIKSTFQETENVPKLWLIAKACAVNKSEFSSKHSMLPVMYPISRYVGTEREAGNKHHHRIEQVRKTDPIGFGSQFEFFARRIECPWATSICQR
jgi:hypothetical protein